MAERLPGGSWVVLGPGDDAAVVRAPDGRVVATTDLLIEGRHFRRDWSGPADIGRKAAARNLADVAAMGARPTALLVAFAGPAQTEVAWVLEVVRGIAEECAAAGASVVGGDTSSADMVMLAITALGDLGGREPVTRSGARPGDVVAIAGTLGAAAAGLALLNAGTGADAAESGGLGGLISAHRRPAPPYQAGPEAAALGVTSMIDISDGLVADLGHVAMASGVQVRLRSAALAAEPVASRGQLAAAARLLAARSADAGEPGAAPAMAPAGDSAQAASARREPAWPGWLRWVLAGGDDHALAATFPADIVLPPGWTLVGEIADGCGVRVDGRKWSEMGGWEHFRT